MAEMIHRRQFALPPTLQDQILELIQKSQVQWQQLAQAIKELSDHFNASKGRTPWNNPNMRLAYLSYFLPLNLIRLRAVFREMNSLGLSHSQVVDFGSGPGTALLAALAENVQFQTWQNVEIEPSAEALYRQFVTEQNAKVSFQRDWPKVVKGATIVASYSLNELNQWPQQLAQAENLVLIEPATQKAGRRLQEFRKSLCDSGFFIWAPCTHQLACPLLIESKSDWCHDRVFTALPSWFSELERFLPMRNDTVTFSYLIASRKQPPASNLKARVIGDTLYERGKVRQAVCRGPKREFLSWLTKTIEPKEVPRGLLVEIPTDGEIKGNEIRLKKDL